MGKRSVVDGREICSVYVELHALDIQCVNFSMHQLGFNFLKQLLVCMSGVTSQIHAFSKTFYKNFSLSMASDLQNIATAYLLQVYKPFGCFRWIKVTFYDERDFRNCQTS